MKTKKNTAVICSKYKKYANYSKETITKWALDIEKYVDNEIFKKLSKKKYKLKNNKES